jgi:integrase
MILGGLRIGEAVALRIGDIKNDEITIASGKGGKGRTVPLLPRCKAIIDEYRRALPYWHGPNLAPHMWLFPNIRDTTRHIVPTKATWWFTTTARELGFTGVTSHALRHLYATTLHRNGARTNDIRDLLGHANLQSTQVYLHSTATDIRDAAMLHPLAK